MLGALDGFDDAERVVDVAAMPELERYVLHLLAELDAKLRVAVDDFDFNTYIRALTEYMADDLSSFFFDIRKDCLYCDAPTDPKRRAYRTVLDTLFHALIRYAAPVLVFTAEEIWASRYPDAASVHLLEWPVVDAGWMDSALADRWVNIRASRAAITEAIEPLRRDKIVRSSLEADVVMPAVDGVTAADMAEIAIVASVDYAADAVTITPTTMHKCGRCWRHLPDVSEDGTLCGRCETVLGDA